MGGGGSSLKWHADEDFLHKTFVDCKQNDQKRCNLHSGMTPPLTPLPLQCRRDEQELYSRKNYKNS